MQEGERFILGRVSGFRGDVIRFSCVKSWFLFVRVRERAHSVFARELPLCNNNIKRDTRTGARARRIRVKKAATATAATATATAAAATAATATA